ncbi:ribonucleoside triphosphate reductase [Candidatus Woesearchaeota archaeon B3_Woes]|nr:MAG: ribonucleoside triphosphate reductase [Candidatus Woesearchaeota archaeon B3_Woes]
MKCPKCSSEKLKVIDKRSSEDSLKNRRRRECNDCGNRFTTYEQIVEDHLIAKIRKRNGKVVDFSTDKITNAIFQAAKSVGGSDKDESKKLSKKVIETVKQKFNEDIPSVEEVQDIVEKVLVEEGHSKTAKSYILYRDQHKKLRDGKTTFVNVQKVISTYLDQNKWDTKENSNESYSFSGLLLYTAGEVMKNYNLNELYSLQVSEAHKKGDMHIHDLSHGVIGYCAGWSLKNLLLKGFGGVANKVDCKPAKHMSTVVHQMVNFIGCLQMEFAGAQAFSSVDTLLAPFIKTDNLTYKQVKQAIQQLVFSLNIPSRWGSQYPFSNLTFDWKAPEDLKNDKAIVGGVEQDFTYGDCQKEMDMINKAFIEVMLEGDANGRIFTFPIPTYNLTKDFDWNDQTSNLLFDLTAKYGTPYFQNYIGSNLDPKSIRAMCCRLNLDQNELMNRPGGMWGPGDSTGSIGVVTINMNRLGYENKTKEEFFDKLSHYMELGKISLETKRKVVDKNLENGLMPFTKRYLGTFDNHFSTIGICGMHECCLNFVGKGIESEEGVNFTIEVMNFMRGKLKEFQNETKNLYNLEATPAESTAYRFARLDKELYGDKIITSGKDEPFLTNSTQLSVDHTDDAIEAVEHQDKIQSLYTGGTIFHTFLGEKMNSGESCKRLVKKIAYNTKLPYFTITPTFSICSKHGYTKGEVYECKECGGENEVYSRIVGYFRPIKQWNRGKAEEFKFREEYCEQKSLDSDFKSKIEPVLKIKNPD